MTLVIKSPSQDVCIQGAFKRINTGRLGCLSLQEDGYREHSSTLATKDLEVSACGRMTTGSIQAPRFHSYVMLTLISSAETWAAAQPTHADVVAVLDPPFSITIQLYSSKEKS